MSAASASGVEPVTAEYSSSMLQFTMSVIGLKGNTVAKEVGGLVVDFINQRAAGSKLSVSNVWGSDDKLSTQELSNRLATLAGNKLQGVEAEWWARKNIGVMLTHAIASSPNVATNPWMNELASLLENHGFSSAPVLLFEDETPSAPNGDSDPHRLDADRLATLFQALSASGKASPAFLDAGKVMNGRPAIFTEELLRFFVLNFNNNQSDAVELVSAWRMFDQFGTLAQTESSLVQLKGRGLWNGTLSAMGAGQSEEDKRFESQYKKKQGKAGSTGRYTDSKDQFSSTMPVQGRQRISLDQPRRNKQIRPVITHHVGRWPQLPTHKINPNFLPNGTAMKPEPPAGKKPNPNQSPLELSLDDHTMIKSMFRGSPRARMAQTARAQTARNADENQVPDGFGSEWRLSRRFNAKPSLGPGAYTPSEYTARRTAPSYGFGTASRFGSPKQFHSKGHVNELIGRGSPGPCHKLFDEKLRESERARIRKIHVEKGGTCTKKFPYDEQIYPELPPKGAMEKGLAIPGKKNDAVWLLGPEKTKKKEQQRAEKEALMAALAATDCELGPAAYDPKLPQKNNFKKLPPDTFARTPRFHETTPYVSESFSKRNPHVHAYKPAPNHYSNISHKLTEHQRDAILFHQGPQLPRKQYYMQEPKPEYPPREKKVYPPRADNFMFRNATLDANIAPNAYYPDDTLMAKNYDEVYNIHKIKVKDIQPKWSKDERFKKNDPQYYSKCAVDHSKMGQNSPGPNYEIKSGRAELTIAKQPSYQKVYIDHAPQPPFKKVEEPAFGNISNLHSETYVEKNTKKFRKKYTDTQPGSGRFDPVEA